MKKLIGVLAYLLVVMGASFYLRQSFSARHNSIFYTPPANALKLMSGTFRSSCADVFYVRGILAVTDDLNEDTSRVDWVQSNMKTALELDPRLIDAYFFGGVVCAKANDESLRRGIAFLEHGTVKSPQEWRIWYWKGFLHYQLGEYIEAAQCYQKAAPLPGAPPFLRGIQPMMFYNAGEIELGIAQIEGMLQTLRDERQLALIKSKLVWLKNIAALQKLVGLYQKQRGTSPQSLGDLVTAGLLARIPEDPFGGGYYLDAEGKVKSSWKE